MKRKLKLAGVLIGVTLATAGSLSADNEMPNVDKNATEVMDANKTAMDDANKTAMAGEANKTADKKVGAGK